MNIPDVVPGAEELTDIAREARTQALTWLDGDFGNFGPLYETTPSNPPVSPAGRSSLAGFSGRPESGQVSG